MHLMFLLLKIRLRVGMVSVGTESLPDMREALNLAPAQQERGVVHAFSLST